MKRIEEFKSFVRERPTLINYVENNEMSWQKFYEMWDLYGPDDNVWGKYTEIKDVRADGSIDDFMGIIKNINPDGLRKNITNIQKGISLFQELLKKEKVEEPIESKEPYSPRPMYRRFED